MMKKSGLLYYVQKLLFSESKLCVICNQRYSIDSFISSRLSDICPNCIAKIEYIHPVHRSICPICGRKQSDDHKCNDCNRRDVTYFRFNRSAVMYNLFMKEWISTYKFRGREQLAVGLTDLLVGAYDQFFKQVKIDLITFVPLHKERLYERKFNQAEQLARRLSTQIGIPVHPLLERIIDTPKQSQQKRLNRIVGIQGAFHARENLPTFKSVLIIDDIYTTGSTLNECAKVLIEKGYSDIYTLTVARA